MKELTIKDFDKVYELLQLSFIADELRPYEAQKALLKEPIYHIYGEVDSVSGKLKAFIAIWNFLDFVFVDYFAVHPIFRNQKLGEKMLKSLLQMTSLPVCLEIETPENEMSHRRLHFYQRNGFQLCAFPYEQPPIARGNGPVKLSLMSSSPISQQVDFEKIRSVIYEYAYKRFL